MLTTSTFKPEFLNFVKAGWRYLREALNTPTNTDETKAVLNNFNKMNILYYVHFLRTKYCFWYNYNQMI